MSIGRATQEVMYLRALLKAIGKEQIKPTVIYEDNEGCIAMCKNPVQRERSKHIYIKWNFVKGATENGVIAPTSCRTDKMVADGFTKSLPAPAHHSHLSRYMNTEATLRNATT